MTHIEQILRRGVRRYRMALLGRTTLQVALILGILAAIVWRLAPLQGAGWMGRGFERVVLGVAVAVIVGFIWWARRRWLSGRLAVQTLDDALHLEQRLVTATEFAQKPEHSALYPILLEDTISRLKSLDRRRPRVVDRTSAFLMLLLLVALLIPWNLRGRATHLAQLSGQVPHPPEPPSAPARDQSPHPDASRQPNPSPGPGSPQPSENSSNAPSPNDSRKPSPSGAGQPQESSGQSDQQRDQSQKPQESSGQQHESSGADGGEHSSEQASAGQPQASADARESPQPEGARQAGAGAQQAPQGTRGQSDRQPNDGQGAKAQAAGSGSSANQQVLKGEIQELLKELQGQLREMQGQLAAQNTERSHPQAGIGSDPNLYTGAESVEVPQTPQAPVPLQLETDEAPSASKRRGSGVGAASGEIATSGPQMSREATKLSDAPREETSSRRRAVPPEYQGVFERLSDREAPSGQTATP